MEITELPSPELRETESLYKAPVYPIVGRRYLPKPECTPSTSFAEVFSRRRTRRSFGVSSESDISNLLWHASKILETRVEPSGFVWSHRGSPSAGGRHPISIVVLQLGATGQEPELYDPLGHCLCRLELEDARPLEAYAALIRSIIGTTQGTCLCYVADLARSATKYRHCESLVWRDAGCLLATMQLVAEWHGLNFCAVGPTGEPFVSQAFGCPDRLRGVGACVIGGRESA